MGTGVPYIGTGVPTNDHRRRTIKKNHLREPLKILFGYAEQENIKDLLTTKSPRSMPGALSFLGLLIDYHILACYLRDPPPVFSPALARRRWRQE